MAPAGAELVLAQPVGAGLQWSRARRSRGRAPPFARCSCEPQRNTSVGQGGDLGAEMVWVRLLWKEVCVPVTWKFRRA
jgi:hypothetical protein